MVQTRRWKLSAEQRSDLWKRWKAGESLNAIGRALGKEHHVIHFLLARHGGIAPPVRRRSLRALTLAEREDISRGIASGSSIRGIARGLKRAVSTVSREVARHGGRSLYRASEADRQAWQSALRPKPCRLATQHKLQEIVASNRGLEMAQHKSFTIATDVQVYFCDPQSPWQRGSNENTNGLLRQYLPKKADLSCYSQPELDAIALRLNQRPQKTLGFQTPADKLQASVASTP